MLYTIEDKTLTALGDIIRNYTIGQSEPPQLSTSFSMNYMVSKNEKNSRSFHFNNVSKIKAIINITWEGSLLVNMPIWVAPGVFEGKYNPLPNGATVLPNDEAEFPYEIIIDGTDIGFGVNQGSGFNTANIVVDLVGLDENGNEFKYTPLEMVDEVNGIIEDFNNAPITPEEAFTITGNCSSRFSNNGWNWFIKYCGDKVTTKDISMIMNMFYNSDSLEEIPFDLNTKATVSSYNYVFSSCSKLKQVPYIIGPERTPPTSSYSGAISLENMFNSCAKLQSIPNDYFWKMIPNKDYWDKNATLTSQSYSNLFYYCRSLREHPDISMLGGAWTSSYGCIYYYLFRECWSLDRIVDLPVCGKFTSNAFSSIADNCYRLRDFIFAVNEDGTPKTAQWKNQTINTKMFGYVVSSNESKFLNLNHGITADKKVFDDASYQLLKDDPDYYTTNERYSLYNHDAAVRTINSLPDCSATGTNTIYFQGNYGLYTDGGAINTLTEEEIAVAAAKGWTVSLS
jgi:hypothetical protein